jgi:hypothetical protein
MVGYLTHPLKRCVAQFTIVGPGAIVDLRDQCRLHKNVFLSLDAMCWGLLDSPDIQLQLKITRQLCGKSRSNMADVDQLTAMSRCQSQGGRGPVQCELA